MQIAAESTFALYVVVVVLVMLFLSRYGGYVLIRRYVGNTTDEKRTSQGRNLAIIVFGVVGIVLMMLSVPIFQVATAAGLVELAIGVVAVVVVDWFGVRLAAKFYQRVCHGP